MVPVAEAWCYDSRGLTLRRYEWRRRNTLYRKRLTRTFVFQSSSRGKPAVKLHGRLAFPKPGADFIEVLVCLKRKQRRDRPRARDGEVIALQRKVCGFVDVVGVVLHLHSWARGETRMHVLRERGKPCPPRVVNSRLRRSEISLGGLFGMQRYRE